MTKYLVLHDYKSHAAQYKTGDVVELQDDFAEWLNRDSPGVITDQIPETPKPADRMVRAPGKSRSRK